MGVLMDMSTRLCATWGCFLLAFFVTFPLDIPGLWVFEYGMWVVLMIPKPNDFCGLNHQAVVIECFSPTSIVSVYESKVDIPGHVAPSQSQDGWENEGVPLRQYLWTIIPWGFTMIYLSYAPKMMIFHSNLKLYQCVTYGFLNWSPNFQHIGEAETGHGLRLYTPEIPWVFGRVNIVIWCYISMGF